MDTTWAARRGGSAEKMMKRKDTSKQREPARWMNAGSVCFCALHGAPRVARCSAVQGRFMIGLPSPAHLEDHHGVRKSKHSLRSRSEEHTSELQSQLNL